MLQMIQGWDDQNGETEPGFDNQNRGYITVPINLTRFGVGGAAAFGSPYNEKYYNLGTPADTAIIGSAVKVPTPYQGATPPGFYYYNFLGLAWVGDDYQGIELILAGGVENRLHVRTSAANGPDSGSGNTHPTTFLVPYDQWFYVELKGRFAYDNTGLIEVHVNGSVVLTFTGKTQSLSGAAKKITKGYISNCGIQTWHDDTYICDTTGDDCNDFLGDVRVAPLRPSAPGDSTQLTSSEGPNWDAANGKTGRNLATYVSATAPGLQDLYNLPDLPGNSSTIEVFGVQVVGTVNQESGSDPTMGLLTKAGGSIKQESASLGPVLEKIFFETIPAGTTNVNGAPTIVDWYDTLGGSTKAIQCADLGDGTDTSFTFTFTTTATKYISFRYEVSSENSYDFGSITVDGQVQFNVSGQGGWRSSPINSFPAGTHTVTVRFIKDSSASSGFDNIRVGQLQIGDSVADFGAVTVVPGAALQAGAVQTEDPAGNPWTIDTINAMQIGVKSL